MIEPNKKSVEDKPSPSMCRACGYDYIEGRLEQDRLREENERLKKEVFQYEGGEEDGYGDGGTTQPVTWKEAYEENERYESWALKEMQKACDLIKAHPEYPYDKERSWPSPYERAIVAGCTRAVRELKAQLTQSQGEVAQLKNILDDAISFLESSVKYFKDRRSPLYTPWFDGLMAMAKFKYSSTPPVLDELGKVKQALISVRLDSSKFDGIEIDEALKLLENLGVR